MKYFLLAIIGSILTPLAHEIATSQRGYGAIGGEFLIIPLILIAALAVEQVKEAIEEAKEVVKQTLDKCEQKRITDWATLKTNIRNEWRNFLYEKTKRNPMILPIIMEI